MEAERASSNEAFFILYIDKTTFATHMPSLPDGSTYV